MLRIAIPNKGRLADDTRALFESAGLEIRASSERALTASIGGAFEALFVRAQDIPEFVADGAADAGITGLDRIVESGRELETLTDLEFGRCRLAVAAPDDSPVRTVADIPPRTRIATSFPNATQLFFDRAGIPITIVPISGAAEIAPHLGIAEVIVDLVSSGSTLAMNGLREVATIFESSARLIGPCSSDGSQRREIDDLVSALQSVVRARSRRYLMANVRRDRLVEVREVLPGLNGPTVVDILDGGDLVAVHAVVDACGIFRTISDLRAIGAQGVLVTRIERLVP